MKEFSPFKSFLIIANVHRIKVFYKGILFLTNLSWAPASTIVRINTSTIVRLILLLKLVIFFLTYYFLKVLEFMK